MKGALKACSWIRSRETSTGVLEGMQRWPGGSFRRSEPLATVPVAAMNIAAATVPQRLQALEIFIVQFNRPVARSTHLQPTIHWHGMLGDRPTEDGQAASRGPIAPGAHCT
jgi:hypothetical protein